MHPKGQLTFWFVLYMGRRRFSLFGTKIDLAQTKGSKRVKSDEIESAVT